MCACGMMRGSHLPTIHMTGKALQAAEVRTGNLGFGNKGAVMVRLRVHDEPIAVVCAHLASGEQLGDGTRRIADFSSILLNGRFPEGAEEGSPEVEARFRCVPREHSRSRHGTRPGKPDRTVPSLNGGTAN
jgi:hypothetical protein